MEGGGIDMSPDAFGRIREASNAAPASVAADGAENITTSSPSSSPVLICGSRRVLRRGGACSSSTDESETSKSSSSFFRFLEAIGRRAAFVEDDTVDAVEDAAETPTGLDPDRVDRCVANASHASIERKSSPHKRENQPCTEILNYK